MRRIIGILSLASGSGLWWQFLQFRTNSEGTAMKLAIMGIIATLLIVVGVYTLLSQGITTSQSRVQPQ